LRVSLSVHQAHLKYLPIHSDLEEHMLPVV
jgi:hypothetical protein